MNITEFEKKIGIEMPSDYYEFLSEYGGGNFDSYIYICNPLSKNGLETFLKLQELTKNNYKYLKENDDTSRYADCGFVDNELVLLNEN